MLVKHQISKKCFFLSLMQNCSSFFSSKPSAIMADVGKLLWSPTSYVAFVVVNLYLGLWENICTCEFHRHWRFLYTARHYFIVELCKVNLGNSIMVWQLSRLLLLTLLFKMQTLSNLLNYKNYPATNLSQIVEMLQAITQEHGYKTKCENCNFA